MTIAARSQSTLAGPAVVSGRGYWSGAEVRVEFRPAEAGTGIVFVRDDLGSAARAPLAVAVQQPSPRRTILRSGGDADGVSVEMVEHAAAALAGLGVDNCEVGVTAAELPGMDGSALAFVEAIDAAGRVRQEEPVHPLAVTRPVRREQGDAWIEARPSADGQLTIEYSLDFGPGSVIPAQWTVLTIDPMSFRSELAPARTFLLKSEADAIRARGLGSHVSTTDLLIFDDTAAAPAAAPAATTPAAPIGNTLRYPDECVRHKVLDIVGDLALAGRPVVGRIVACRSGHQLNADLVRELLASESAQPPGRRCA